MPLSPRFEELMDGLELKDALWHLQRTNLGREKATQERIITATDDEIIAWYSRVLALAWDGGRLVSQILEETPKTIDTLPPLEVLIEKRGNLVRQWWVTQNDDAIHAPYQEVVWEIAEYVRLSKLQKQAQKLQNGDWINRRHIIRSVLALQATSSDWDISNRLYQIKILEHLWLATRMRTEKPPQSLAA